MKLLKLIFILCIAILSSAMLIYGAEAPVMDKEGDSAEDLAKKAQNPVSDMISLPFQNNTNFNVGPGDDVQNILNIQPVWPISVTENWNVITRTILPVMWQPGIMPGDDYTFGLGDINFTAFLSPAKPGAFIWGIGPIFSFPTATDDVLGTKKWGIGPSIVVLKIQGPWVYGALINNIWSFAGDDDRQDVNQMLLQPFVNYNLPKGWYITSSPIITANWEADDDNCWTIPVGIGLGKIVKIGNQPVNISAAGYYNIESPDDAAEWQIRLQVQLLFPK